MRALLRRRAREVLDDGVDRLRRDAISVICLHVLPSLPFVGATLWWFVDIDLRGRLPDDRDVLLGAFLLPKMLGWAALSAWAAASARGQPIGVARAWRRAVTRFPESLLATSIILIGLPLGFVTASLGWLLSAVGLVGLAAGVGPRSAGGMTLVRAGWQAVTHDLPRCLSIVLCCALAFLFLTVNLVILPFLLTMLGAGGLGVDMNLVVAALRPDRAAAWAGAALIAALAVEAILVAAFAELSVERDAERDGTRFDLFADELDARRITDHEERRSAQVEVLA